MGVEAAAQRESALAIKVRLPPDLERFRVAHVPNAALGVPAHVTLIYPFVPAEQLDAVVRRRVAGALASQPPFAFRLSTVRRWPNTLYLAVEPAAPVEGMVRSLVAAFPEHPPYGGAFPYVPHVTLAEDEGSALAELAAPPLPAGRRQVTRVLLIAQGRDGRWRLRWRFELRRSGPAPAGSRSDAAYSTVNSNEHSRARHGRR
jgi:2'-5' RNA ligase